MRKLTFASIAMLGSFLLASTGIAQQQQTQQSPALKSQQSQSQQGQSAMGQQEPQSGQQLQWAQKSSDVLDKKIMSSDGKDLGKAKDLVIGKDGKIEYVIIASGGVLGIGSEHIAVPWDKIRSTGNVDQLMADVSQSEIQQLSGEKREQKTGSTKTARTDKGQQEQSMTLSSLDSERAKEFMGQKVVGKNDEELGKVKDLLTKEDGKPMYVVIQDESQKLHPVPAQIVRTNPKEKKMLSADLDKQAFMGSPSFDQSQLAQQQQWEPTVRSYYQQQQKPEMSQPSGAQPPSGDQGGRPQQPPLRSQDQ